MTDLLRSRAIRAVNLVAKIMQSAYLCVIFHVKHKKLPFLAVLTWFWILGKIQDGNYCWWRQRPPAAPPPIKTWNLVNGSVWCSKYRNTKSIANDLLESLPCCIKSHSIKNLQQRCKRQTSPCMMLEDPYPKFLRGQWASLFRKATKLKSVPRYGICCTCISRGLG